MQLFIMIIFSFATSYVFQHKPFFLADEHETGAPKIKKRKVLYCFFKFLKML